MSVPPSLRIALPALSFLALAACHDEKVTSYTIPKDADEPAAMAMPLASAPSDASAGAPAAGGAMSGAVPTASGPGLAWSAPADWTEFAPKPMRRANYRITGPDGEAEVSITAFPGDVGGELANVNRWRGQAGLPPTTDADLESQVTRLAAGSLRITVVDAAGTSSHLLGAIVPYSDGTWFFKITGPSAAVAREKPEFLAFLRTLKPAVSP